MQTNANMKPNMSKPASKAARMRALINDPKIVVSPGVYDGYGILLAQQAGYQAVSTTGAGIVNARWGISENYGVMSLLENVEACRQLAAAVDIPLMADADTGYGNAVTVTQTVRHFEAAGVVGINIEDQTFPKRCGHTAGKELIDAREMAAKISAAASARRDDDFIIVARTDSIAVEGMDAAVERAKLYAKAGADVVAQELSTRLGQNVFVDNRAGASGTIGSEAVARSAPDGYTLVLSNVGSQGVEPSLFSTVKYDAVADFTHMAMIGTFPNVMLAHPGVAAKNLQEFVAQAKASPGKFNYATCGNGSTNHFMGELLKFYAGVNMVHVPYKGSGPALTDLVGKQIEYMFDSMPSAAQYIRNGSVRALAVSGEQRSPAFPNVPTFKESGFDKIVISNWFGLSGPARVPADIVNRVNAEMKVVLAQPAIVTRLDGLGLTAQSMPPEQFARFVAADVEGWKNAVKNTGIKAE